MPRRFPMQAIVKTEFKGVPDGQQHARTFRPGDTVTGLLADVAIQQGWAVSTDAPKKKAGSGTAKRGRASQPGPVSRKNKSSKSKRPVLKLSRSTMPTD